MRAVAVNLPLPGHRSGRIRITDAVLKQVKNMDAHSVLDLNFTQVVECTGPYADLLENARQRSRNEYVPRISAIHHALRDVDSSARNIPVRVNVRDAINGTGVQTHPQFQFRVAGQLLRQLDSAPYRCFGISKKHQRHPIPGGQRNQLFLAPCSSEFRCADGYLLECFHLFPLVVHRKLRVAHNVDE